MVRRKRCAIRRAGAGARPPTLAVDRNPAQGDWACTWVSGLCGAYGWTTVAGRKHVWARIDYTRAERPGWVPSAPYTASS
jgi:hypothetical protein